MELLDLVPLTLLTIILGFWAVWGFLLGTIMTITATLLPPLLTAAIRNHRKAHHQ